MSKVTFKGFARGDRSVGTRNYIGVVSTVVCSSVVTRDIAKTVPEGIPVVHANGCAQLGDDFLLTKNTLKGVVANPNIYASLLVGLGCETNQVSILLDETVESKPKAGFSIQQMAGGSNTLQAGSEIVKKWSEEINEMERLEMGIENLTIGILPIELDIEEYQSASPSVSTFMKELVESNATVVLGMTDKMEKVLESATSRASNEEIKAQMLSISSKNTRQTWDKMNPDEIKYLQYGDADFQLGLEELKLSQGIVIESILKYAEIPHSKGLHLAVMPNNVIEAASNLVASGCNLIVFLTNRAIFTGTIAVPCMTIGVMNKEKQSVEMIDLLIDEHVSSSDILQKVIDISSGQLTKLEGFKLEEFAISHIGTTF